MRLNTGRAYRNGGHGARFDSERRLLNDGFEEPGAGQFDDDSDDLSYLDDDWRERVAEVRQARD